MERDVTRRHSKTMNIRKTLPAVAGFFIAATAFAVQHNLPTPGPSEYVDTESAANVAVTNWPGLGRRVKLTLSANFTPSNCVQIALGQDSDSNGDLAPEETMLCIGVDCGEPFARWEEGVENRCRCVDLEICSAGQHNQEDDVLSTPTPTLYTFSFKQPSAVSSRVDFAKVTTRGRGNSAAEIAAEVIRPGVALILR